MKIIKFSMFIIATIGLACQAFGQDYRNYNSAYKGKFLDRIAFPIGGIGAGMICLEGTGALSHVSVRNQPDVFNEPFLMAAISVKGLKNGTKVLEGPVPEWKIFGPPNTGSGSWGKSYGFPRFAKAEFKANFPFGTVKLKDEDIPLIVTIKGWSPFIPTDENSSSLPVGGFEYTFRNTGEEELEAVFSYNAENIMRIEIPSEWGGIYEQGHSIEAIHNGFLLRQDWLPEHPDYKGDFAVFTSEPGTIVDLCWFRGGWFDPKTVLWKDISEFTYSNDTTTLNSPGASLFVPFHLKPGEEKTFTLMMAWYTPHSLLREGLEPVSEKQMKAVIHQCTSVGNCEQLGNLFYEPYYAGKFKNVHELIEYWKVNYDNLKEKTQLFTNSFYNSTLPPEVIEAVTANLSILKSPTVLRQKDGKFWAWEGCLDKSGSCYGSCTHVWNYSQAIAHLFPNLERSLRETEFLISQDETGHQNFRTSLPIQMMENHSFYAAADGQLGGIIKVYRDWRISGNTDWLKSIYPYIKKSLDYCINIWDPKHKGIVEEPHHNTYDVEFWGPGGMCTSFYLGALSAMIEMGNAINVDVSGYSLLLKKGKVYLENELFNNEYFFQRIKVDGLEAKDPVKTSETGIRTNYSPEALALLTKEGPKYQYGKGCLSDGIVGAWLGEMAGLPGFIDELKVKKHLNSVYNYNFKKNLTDHVNPQRSTYALGNESGLLLCSWPEGNDLTLSFPYSNEVWTGIEYQVASHLMRVGEVEKGLEIVRAVRNRYNGKVRNPFNEYECGHWYARALSSYGLLQGLTGVRYDAVEQFLYINSQIGDFKSFLSTNKGFGNIELNNGKVKLDVVYGEIPVKKVVIE
jgi:uncharacterized protein (DUF608 family)